MTFPSQVVVWVAHLYQKCCTGHVRGGGGYTYVSHRGSQQILYDVGHVPALTVDAMIAKVAAMYFIKIPLRGCEVDLSSFGVM